MSALTNGNASTVELYELSDAELSYLDELCKKEPFIGCAKTLANKIRAAVLLEGGDSRAVQEVATSYEVEPWFVRCMLTVK